MKKYSLLIYTIVAIFTISCSDGVTDKFRNDLENSGVYNSDPVTKTPKEIWKFKTNGRIHASVVYDGKSVFMGSEDQAFYSLDAETGKQNWSFETNGPIYSTAVINKLYIYILSYDGFLYKLNKKTGELVWKFNSEGEKTHIIKNYYDYSEFVSDFWDFYQSSPLISGDNIYFGSGNIFYAVNINSAKPLWTYKTEGVVHSSPALDDNKIVFGSFDSRIYCLDIQTGNEIWTCETGRDTAQYIWLGVQASPVIDNHRVYVGSRDAKIYCLNINTGDTVWTNDNFELSWMPSSFAVTESKIYSG